MMTTPGLLEGRVSNEPSTYDPVARMYDEDVLARPFHRAWDAKIRSLLDQHVPMPQLSPFHAIDLGCGTGLYTKDLLRKGFRVTAIDNSPQMIEVTRERAKAYEGRLTTFLDDVLEADYFFRPSSVIVAFGALLNHLEAEAWQGLFKKVHLSLVKNGLFLFDIENPFGVDYLFYAIYSHLLDKQGKPSWEEMKRGLLCHFSSSSCTHQVSWFVGDGDIELQMSWRSLHATKTLLRQTGFEVLYVDGANLFSCILPSVALSSYHPVSTRRPREKISRLLSAMDMKLSRSLHGIAGIHFVIARRV